MFLLAAIALPVLLVQIVLGYLSFQAEKEKELRANLELAHSVAATLNIFVADVGRQDLTLGEAILPWLDSSLPQVTDILKEHDEEYQAVRAFSWIDANGIILASSLDRVVGLDVGYRDYFQQALAAPQWVVSDLILGGADDKPIFMVARSVRDRQGVLRGVMTASIDPEQIGPLVSVPRTRTGTITLFDRQGRLVYRSPALKEPLTWERRATGWQNDMMKEAQAGREAVGVERLPYDGRERLAARVPIDNGWVAGAARDMSEVVTAYLWRMLAILCLNGVAIGGSLAAVWAIRRRLGLGIVAVREHALALQHGGIGRAASPAYEVRELAEVAEAITVLASSLQQRLAELCQGEQRLRATFDRAAMGIVEVDEHDRFVAVNDRALEILGYSRPEMLQMDVHQLTAPQDRDLSDTLNGRLHKGIHDRLDYEKRYLKGDGSVVWVHVTVSAVRDSEGRFLRSIGTIEDISDRKRAEEALRSTVEQLARSNSDLEQFAYVTTHDLQEPLRMVIAYARLLAKEFKDRLGGKGEQYIEFALQGAELMNQMVQDLLAYSRASRAACGLAAVPAERALAAAMANLQRTIEETGARITCDPLPVVQAEEDQLAQLFHSLLSNAMKFQPPSQRPEIHVGCRMGEGECEFFVRDNGIGIAPQYQQRIFQIFQRLHTRRIYPGTGIGLAICKNIVERHGGRMSVESVRGEGAEFRFTLKAA